MAKIKTTTRLDYYDGKDLQEEGTFRISASGVQSFFSSTPSWYNEAFLGDEGFTGSTQSILGTCVHFYSEDHFINGFVDTNEIEKYIQQFEDPENEAYNEEIDTAHIRYQYPIMGEALLLYIENSEDIASEDFITTQTSIKEIVAGGSCDKLCKVNPHTDPLTDRNAEACVIDYKTTSSLSAPTTISKPYKWQLLEYAAAYREKGINVTMGKIVYITTHKVGRVSEKTGKPLKNYPTEVSSVSFIIEDSDIEFIRNVNNLIAKSVKAFHEYPELRDVISQDYRITSDTQLAVKLFKDKVEEIDPDDI